MRRRSQKRPRLGCRIFHHRLSDFHRGRTPLRVALDARAFERAAATELGPGWKTVVSEGSRAVGLLFDSDRVTLLETREHGLERGRKVLEARLRPRRGPKLRVFAVHLKAGGTAKDIELRRVQLDALARVVEPVVRTTRDEIVVLGDFNSTSGDDRRQLRRFAERTGLSWASEGLECTAYWDRRQDDRRTLRDCPGSALDHVFTRRAPASIAAKGQCEDIGCDGGLLCPVSRFVVSDHCPVLTEL
jgi:endonuclease/exonuclease/phosphatase family metal-dependent hydrolase